MGRAYAGKHMTRRFIEDRLVIASHNQGKVGEIDALLAPFSVEVVSLGEFNLPEPEESGTTFRENAVIKAVAAAIATGLPALADDSGLEVSALDGAPGIHSARWAGPGRDFSVAMARVARELSDAADRSARFVCALALAWPVRPGAAELAVFEDAVEGEIVWPPRGDRGFGYDPVFKPRGHDITFGEMEPQAKHAISHRAAAFRQLVAACFGGEDADHR